MPATDNPTPVPSTRNSTSPWDLAGQDSDRSAWWRLALAAALAVVAMAATASLLA